MNAYTLLVYAMMAVNLLLGTIAAVLSVMALLRAASVAESTYTFYGKRSKGFWMALTGGASVVSVLGLLASLSGVGTNSMLLQLIAVTIAGVFLAGVYPSVRNRNF